MTSGFLIDTWLPDVSITFISWFVIVILFSFMSLEIDQLFLFLGNAGWTGGGFSSNFKDDVLVSNYIHVYLMLIAN